MPYSVHELTGFSPQSVAPAHAGRPTERVAIGPDDSPGLLDLDNPLLWVFGLTAVTFGLIGISGSVRVGKARASASLDKG